MIRSSAAVLMLSALTIVGEGCSRSETPSAAAVPSHQEPLAVAAHSAKSIARARSVASGRAGVSAPPSSLAPPAHSAATNVEVLGAEERTLRFESSPVGAMNVVVLLPERRSDARFPVLIAMHGRGEALKGPERGARGWVDDYDIGKTVDRLRHPPLGTEAFKSFVSTERRARLNRSLAERPYRGLILVFPYTPDMLPGDDPISKAPPLAQFLVDELLPRIYRETPALGTPQSTGIDGVSLGGRAAISVGLLRPEAFGCVASLQAALGREQTRQIGELAQKARVKNPDLKFRLLTSTGDFFRNGNAAIAAALKDAGVPVTFDVVEGPHDYEFNRGPGGVEMLMLHDRVLRGEAAP